MLISRVQWDFKFESWKSRRKMRSWENRYLGKKAVILCNGPSLLEVDFTSISTIFSFGLNKINLLFEDTDFRPSCVVAVNPFVLEQNRSFFRTTDLPLFLDSSATRFIMPSNNKIFLHSTSYPKFAKDPCVSVYQGFTVTFVAMQLAYYLGFQEVAIVGADHNFKAKGKGGTVVSSENEDLSHFSKKYFSGGDQWQLPDLLGSERSYMMAREAFESDGRRIVNSTVGGKLEIFDRVPLQDFL